MNRLRLVLVISAVSIVPVLALPGKKPAPEKTPTLEQVKPVVAKYGCLKCHHIGKIGNMKRVDLTHVGKEHDAKWIYTKIKNPKAFNKKAKMPNKHVTDADAKLLAAFLAAQK